MAMAAAAQNIDTLFSDTLVEEALAELNSQLAGLATLLQDRGQQPQLMSKAAAQVAVATELAKTGVLASENSASWPTSWQPEIVETTQRTAPDHEAAPPTRVERSKTGQATAATGTGDNTEPHRIGLWPTSQEISEPSPSPLPPQEPCSDTATSAKSIEPQFALRSPGLSDAERLEEGCRLAEFPEEIAQRIRRARRFRPEARFDDLLTEAKAAAAARNEQRSWWRRAA